MRIAILGGTGDIGAGLALRFARDTDHSVIIGSRKHEKALDKASEYREALSERGHDHNVSGTVNETAADEGDVVIAGIPPKYVTSTVESLAGALSDGTILVSPAVRMNRDRSGFHYDQPAEGSVAEALAAVAPDEVPVVAAYQNLAAGVLSNLDAELGADVVVTGDDDDATATVRELTEEIDGLRALDGGMLANSAEVEGITPLLINLAMNNDGMHNLGVRFE
jgi:NADPH-dependent F420 reductase